jgi:hypothetical protein
MGCTNLTNKRKHISIIIKPSNSTGGSSHSSNEQIKEDKTKATNSDSDIPIINIPKNATHVELFPSTQQTMLQLWVEKGTTLRFYVNGSWGIYEELPLISYKGYTNLKKFRDFNVGALLCHVQGGKLFNVVDGGQVTADSSGPIYLLANDRSENNFCTGQLNVYIQNGVAMNDEEMELRLGWDIKALLCNSDYSLMTDEEAEIYIYLNKLRSNPKEFAQQYLTHLVNNSNTHKEIYDYLINYSPNKLLVHTEGLYKAARTHSIELGENGLTGNISLSKEDLKTRVTLNCGKVIKCAESIVYNTCNPFNIVLRLLLDEGENKGNRFNIVNSDYNQVGISLSKHITYDWVCVLVFSYN